MNNQILQLLLPIFRSITDRVDILNGDKETDAVEGEESFPKEFGRDLHDTLNFIGSLKTQTV